jgi:dihydroorotate dehydrogenase electron transfer subunit
MPQADPASLANYFRPLEFITRVVDNRPLCREHFSLKLNAAGFPPTDPGNFVQVLCRDPADPLANPYDSETDEPQGDSPPPIASQVTPLLRRPFSLAGARPTDDGQELEIIYRVVGSGTAWMAQRKVGDQVSIIGPLGNRFEPPSMHDDLDSGAVLIGGGVGLPPILYLARRLGADPSAHGRTIAFCGAASRDLTPMQAKDDDSQSPDDIAPASVAEFTELGIPAVLCTDDGSFGFRGYVTQAVERYLQSPRRPALPNLARPTLYACGPEPMLKAVADIAHRHDLPCQIAVERAMACGLGTCQSCVIRVADPSRRNGRDWSYKLTCTDGPIFAANVLRW